MKTFVSVRGIGLLITLFSGAIGLAPCAAVRAEDTLTKAGLAVQLKSGPITGTAKDGLRIYLGIPFAAPPTGELRWKAPVAPEKWTEPRGCTKYGPACPQPIMAESGFLGLSEKDMSEDCLQLNVWTTAKSKEDKLPVMVWIHGGGFILGKSGQSGYDGAELAKRGVVEAGGRRRRRLVIALRQRPGHKHNQIRGGPGAPGSWGHRRGTVRPPAVGEGPRLFAWQDLPYLSNGNANRAHGQSTCRRLSLARHKAAR